jgi:hypothetical protein
VDGQVVCEIDGERLFRKADAATAAIDQLVESGRLREQAVDDHDVRQYYRDGTTLIDDFADSERRIPQQALPTLNALTRTCAVRERCRLRRLQVRPRAARRTSAFAPP